MSHDAGKSLSTERLLEEAGRLRLEGRKNAALEKLKLLLAASPGHLEANFALADLMNSEGNQDQALAALRRAAENAPGNLGVWSRYVLELRLAGKKSRARKAATDAKLPADQRKALRDIAEGRSAPLDDVVRQIRRGDLASAWKTGIERLRQFPDDHRLLNLLGVVALEDTDPVRAEPMLRRSLQAAPGYDAARGNLGLSLLRQGRVTEAIELLEASTRDGEPSLEIRTNLASAYQKMGRWNEADKLASELLAMSPDDPELLGIKCKSLIALGRAAEAARLLQPLHRSDGFALHDVFAEALGETEDYQAAVDYIAGVPERPADEEIRLLSLLGELGALEDASARAKRLAANRTTDPRPFTLLGMFSKWSAADPLIHTMQDGLNAETLAPLKRGAFGLALGKALMDAGRDDEAMEALEKGNGFLRSLHHYDVALDERMMQEIAEHWTAGMLASLETRLDQPAPIFIVGLPRSGSTLIETILSRHPDVEPLGESPVAFDAVRNVRRGATPEDIAQVAGDLAPGLTPGPGRKRKTDKLLANFLNIGALAACFPKARFLEMRRDYRATCLSIYQADLGSAAHPYSTDLGELGRYVVAYDRLMDHWSQVLGSRLCRVDYRALVSSPEAEVPRLLSQLDLDWHPDCLRPEDATRRINTLSVGQARRPISTASLDRWKRFRKGLSPLLQVLEDSGLA